jgi:hypothetical protein
MKMVHWREFTTSAWLNCTAYLNCDPKQEVDAIPLNRIEGWASMRIKELEKERKALILKERRKANIFHPTSYLKRLWWIAGQLNLLKEIEGK